MKRWMLNLAAPLLCIAVPGTGFAAPVYPNTNITDQGGRLGVTLDGNVFTFQGFNAIKIVAVDHGSPLEGVVVPGDFIYSVNSFNLRDNRDIISIVRAGSPGATATIWFFDSRNNYRAMRTDVRLISERGSQEQVASSGSFCGDHPFLCIFGAAIGASFLANAATSGDTASQSDGTCTPAADSDGNYRGRQYCP